MPFLGAPLVYVLHLSCAIWDEAQAMQHLKTVCACTLKTRPRHNLQHQFAIFFNARYWTTYRSQSKDVATLPLETKIIYFMAKLTAKWKIQSQEIMLWSIHVPRVVLKVSFVVLHVRLEKFWPLNWPGSNAYWLNLPTNLDISPIVKIQC